MKNKPVYRLESDGSFIIENYHAASPFSNFFPGIAGIWGIPMWVFYVNRGQGIASFGIESKDKAIMEFQPANKAYRLVSSHGFRTFLKVVKGSAEKYYEPFRAVSASPFRVRQSMRMTSYDLTIEEVNLSLGLTVTVNYFTVPEESFSGLVRKVCVRNNSRSDLKIQMIDGLPAILPYGQNDWVMKNMCRTIEAWYKVRNLEAKAPYFQLDVEAADVPQVKHIKEGNFYFAFDPAARPGSLLDPVVEAALVFGQATDFSVAEGFLESFPATSRQYTDNRTPCAMGAMRTQLKAGAARELVSLTGYATSVDELKGIVEKVTARGYVDLMQRRNLELVEGIKSRVFTLSASPEFNAYCGQTFLDNVMRGGLPISLPTNEGPAVFNVYSRKHGDPERDYNAFRLAPTYLSQGNGNYRDVNQNRRNDVWFNQDVKETAVVNFLSLIQADGYNPLVVCGMMFVAADQGRLAALLDRYVKGDRREALRDFLAKGFMPGDLFRFITDNGIGLRISSAEFLAAVLGVCQKQETAQHGEGFWVDHWTYNLDIIESYLALYPEKLRYILLENKDFSFYQNSVYVLPRDQRFIVTPAGVRQYASLHEGREDKSSGHKMRVHNGRGDVYQTTLIGKLLCLLTAKAATFDPQGIGIEMEANKPGWYDSLNGLPGLLGSSIAETFELKRFARFLLGALDRITPDEQSGIRVFSELSVFMLGLSVLLENDSASDSLKYWRESNTLKEVYRQAVREGIDGQEEIVSVSCVRRFLEGVIAKVDRGVASVCRREGLFPTYFCYSVTRYEWVDEACAGKPGAHVRPLEFKRHDLPLFLEGFVHALRSEPDSRKAAQLHARVRGSDLFDSKLKMYKLNADISCESGEIGRTRVFPRGWLENESIWLHMEYKYLLELLRGGLFEEFYRDFATACVAFMPPERYGRSILENSSFIVSSAHPDKRLHGQGNVARLSGSTAEFVHMWMLMNAGPDPFVFADGQGLAFRLRPALPGGFFTKTAGQTSYLAWDGKTRAVSYSAGNYMFLLMGRMLVVYHNPARRNTFGERAVKVTGMQLTPSSGESPVRIDGDFVGAPYAEDIRNGKIERLDVYLG